MFNNIVTCDLNCLNFKKVDYANNFYFIFRLFNIYTKYKQDSKMLDR